MLHPCLKANQATWVPWQQVFCEKIVEKLTVGRERRERRILWVEGIVGRRAPWK